MSNARIEYMKESAWKRGMGKKVESLPPLNYLMLKMQY